MKKIILLLFVFSFALSSCEKDDLCDANTITTPRIIIEFYDLTKPEELKSVTDLKVFGFDENNAILEVSLGTFSGSKILLPMRAAQDFTKYSLTLNSNVVASANEDLLQFNYNRRNEYVSRACGYKTLFELQNDPIPSETAMANNFWIKNIEVLTNNIKNESETHIKIYF